MSPDCPPLLTVEGLVKRFGGFRALDVLSFDVGAGEILGLVGPNGSGKTTCINVISGLYRPDADAIRFEGRSIGGLRSHRLVHAGINRTFQILRPFLTPETSGFLGLTIEENGADRCAVLAAPSSARRLRTDQRVRRGIVFMSASRRSLPRGRACRLNARGRC
jgi:ABC-type branched-subunit amino acid transport system ATPase component